MLKHFDLIQSSHNIDRNIAIDPIFPLVVLQCASCFCRLETRTTYHFSMQWIEVLTGVEGAFDTVRRTLLVAANAAEQGRTDLTKVR